MTGQKPIWAMRRAGMKPEFIWVSDFHDAYLDGLTVCVAGGTPEIEDFRFLVGVTAIVEGEIPSRVDRIAKACGVHAKRVISSTHDTKLRDVVRVTDTEGIMVWPT